MTGFPYNPETISSLENSISAARLSKYLSFVNNGSLTDALDLYALNAALSGAFILPIQAAEVTLRNKCFYELSSEFGPNWLTDGSFKFVSWQRKEIDYVMEKHGGTVPVASLSFGFWSELFSRNYDNIWRTNLYKIFAARPAVFTRASIFKTLDNIRIFRNRVAHHEQIIGHDPMNRHSEILELIRWLDPKQELWIKHHSRVDECLSCIQSEKTKRSWSGF